MAYALVSAGAELNAAGNSGSITPAFGQTTTAGNLLTCLVLLVQNSAITVGITGITAGWSFAVNQFSTTSSKRTACAIAWKIAAGGDAAPTVTMGTSGTPHGMLVEWSGNASTSPVDQTGAVSGTTASITTANATADVAPGELLLAVMAEDYGTTNTNTNAISFNNGTWVDLFNNASNSTKEHYDFGYAISTSNSTPTNATLTQVAPADSTLVFASFLLASSPKSLIVPNRYNRNTLLRM